MRRIVVTWGAILMLLVVLPGTASAQSATAARILTAALNSGMGQIGGASGADVVDLNTGQTLYSNSAGLALMPASVEKLYTTATALLRFGRSARLTTTVLGSGSIDTQGGWHGTLYLKGGGDPTFGSAGFDQAAYGTGATMQRLVSNLLHTVPLTSIHGAIVGDESYFDSLRGTAWSGFGVDLPDEEGLLSALAYDRGFADFSGTVAQPRPALYATQRFVAALRAAGVKVPASTSVFTTRAPLGLQTLGVVQSPPMWKLIQLTNTPSDNYLAEMLTKGLGARFGAAGTTTGGAAVVRAELTSVFGIAPRVNDGSGLSHTDYTSPRQVVSLLEQMYTNQDFFNSLAIGGETGTLQHEMLGTAAQGACHGKTGTLGDVANLAGLCRARDGHELAFAFLASGIGDTGYVHAVEADRMAAAIARYDG